ncbi:MAG TPA: GNAT family N-acetyltransferase, partial [Rhizomicrobium sp.]
DLARIYIESWQDTYAGILPHALLAAMSRKGHAARWQTAIKGGGAVLVAEDAQYGAIGLCSLGAARDKALGLEGEIYTLYVDPAFLGRGVCRALLARAFEVFKERGLRSCVIWAHAKNNARFFYEKVGGRLIAERSGRMMGDPISENAFGWRRLALAETSRA